MSLDKSVVGSLDSIRSALVSPDGAYADVTTELSFGSARTPNEDRATFVVAGVFMQTEGSEARVAFDIGGVKINDAMINVGSGGLSSTPTNHTKEVITFIVPAGSSYTVRNVLDPTANNAIDHVTELSL